MKYSKIVLFMMILGWGMCSCSLFRSEPPESVENSPLWEYFPIQPDALYTYQVNMDNQNVERALKWQGAENKGGAAVYFFTDGKGFTKAYEFTPEAVLLKGISHPSPRHAYKDRSRSTFSPALILGNVLTNAPPPSRARFRGLAVEGVRWMPLLFCLL